MPLTDLFIPAIELGRVTEGSYEQLISKLQEELSASSERLFGKKCSIELISTFPGYAIAMAEDGGSVRVKFEKTNDGYPKIVSHEPYDLRNFVKDPTAYLEETSRKIVDALFEGDSNKASALTMEMLPLVEEKETLVPSDLVDVVSARFDQICAWKKAYEENLSAIHATVGADLGLVEQGRVEPKFRKLYDGSIPVEERTNYEELVNSDLISITERYEEVYKRINSVVHGMPKATIASERFSQFATSSNDNERALAGFALDLEEDVKQIVKVLREVRSATSDVSSCGNIHDIAARALYRYDIAARYIEIATNKLLNQG
jgi:hypothetical protein